MEQGRPRIVGNEVELHLLEASQHHHVFDHACSLLAADAHEFKAVAMEMERMNIVAGIAEFKPVATTKYS